ncbi:MAG TPA: M28 family peptidase [Thermoanaerobaculia bacterium]|nr:M28 family peptidase [Thermoanaerobaculia bacterium]
MLRDSVPRLRALRLLLLAAGLLLLAGCRAEPRASGPLPPGALPSPASADEFDAGRALAHIRALAVGIGPRPAGSAAEARAAAYLTAELAKLGLRVERQPVPLPEGGASANLVALPAGGDPRDSRHLLVGAHYDTVPGCPGANDNGSGVGAVLEIARALHARPARLPVVLVAFGAEEARPAPRAKLFALGSRRYVESLSAGRRENLIAMINLDMLAGEELVSARRINTRREAHQQLLRLARGMGIPLGEVYVPFPSDNLPFLEAKIPAAWLFTGIDGTLHSPRDVFAGLRAEQLDLAGRLTLAALRAYQ